MRHRLDRFVALACLVSLLLTKGAAIAGAPTPNLDQPSAIPSPSVGATPAPRPNPEILTAVPEVPAAVATPAPNSDQPIAAPSAAVAATPVSTPNQETPTAQPEVPIAAAIDAPIIEQLHNLANGKFDRIIGSTKERLSIDAFYAGRNYAPLWLSDGKANARAQAAIAYLGGVAADGLDPTDYPVPNFASLTDPAALAEAEIRLTTSVITCAHHAQIGRVHWSRVSGDIFYDQNAPDPAEVLSTVMEANDVGEVLAAYEPHAAAYLALKAKLTQLWVRRDNDEAHGRQSDRQTDIIIVNMERWRWMPHDLGNTYVIVNLPDYTLRVIGQGKQVWMTKIVAGKPATPTPIMSAQMKSISVNPTWNVPDSIAAKEYLPLLQQDPTILQRMGLRVSYNADGTIHLSQPPGEQNALGLLRFNFPNKFLVYQHDSNQKQFFANDRRAESHGCMRVQDPVKYAEVLLSMVRPGEGYSQDRIRRMFGAYETDIQFPTFIPVHLTYQTAFVDDQGKLQYREDIYGRDQALLAILKGTERKVADIPVQRKDSTTRRQFLAMPDNPWWGGWGGRGYGGGPNFFTRWFGGSSIRMAPVPRRPVAQHRAYYQ